MCTFKFLVKLITFLTSLFLFILNSNYAIAFNTESAVSEFINTSASIGKGIAIDDKSLSEAAFAEVSNQFVKRVSTKLADIIIKTDLNATKEFADSAVQRVIAEKEANKLRKEFISRISNKYKQKVAQYGNSFAGKLAANVILGIVIDIAANEARDVFGGQGSIGGEFASFTVKQMRVAWAAKKGIHAAVLESAIVTGEQLAEVVKLHNQLQDIKVTNAIKSAHNEAVDSVLQMRIKYKTASPRDKIDIENRIKKTLSEKLYYDLGFFSKKKQIPHASIIINDFISALKNADQEKDKIASAIYTKISNSHPDFAAAYLEHAKKFIKNNYYDPTANGIHNANNPAENQRQLANAAFQTVKERARANISHLKKLIEEARLLGGSLKLTSEKQALMISLAKSIDSSLTNFGDREVLSRAYINYNIYAEKYDIETIDFSRIPISPGTEDAFSNRDDNHLSDELKDQIIANAQGDNTDNDEDDNFPNLGFVAGKVLGESSLFTGNLYTGKEGGGDAPIGQRGRS